MRTLCTALLLAGGLPALAQDAPEEAPPQGEAVEATTDGDAAEGDEAEEAPAPDDLADIKAKIDALQDTIASQQAQIDAQAAKLDEQERELDKQRDGLTKVRLSRAGEKKLKFDVTGYYRARGHVFGAGGVTDSGRVAGALFDDQPTTGEFLNQRLRLGFKVSYKDVANLNVHIQALDNVVWGDNASKARTALFAGNPSLTGTDGLEVPSFELFRVWTEFKIPIGQFRVGRMPSQWGMG
ncbi:MAG: hypothetical protein KDK70_37195, partial [Myxococcales bacterium]|nr:hypothetical protein [Myxococcales bacterium]